MATFVSKVQDNKIILIAWVGPPGHIHKDTQPLSFHALLDTGAQMTCISDKVVKNAGLIAIGHMDILPASGQLIKTQKYKS